MSVPDVGRNQPSPQPQDDVGYGRIRPMREGDADKWQHIAVAASQTCPRQDLAIARLHGRQHVLNKLILHDM